MTQGGTDKLVAAARRWCSTKQAHDHALTIAAQVEMDPHLEAATEALEAAVTTYERARGLKPLAPPVPRRGGDPR